MLVSEALQSKYRNYCSTVMNQYRLTDTKEGLREKARSYFTKTVKVRDSSPRHMIQTIINLCSHKNGNIGIAIEDQKVILLGTL